MKRVALVLLVCLAFSVGPVQAQERPALSTLEISLWPEYDRAEMLVIYRGTFAAETSQPVPVQVRIPASADGPTAVAYVGQDGGRYNQPYTTEVEGEAVVVSFELETRSFQLEYYAPLEVGPSGQRAFSFTYTADYAVNVLRLEAQVPLAAESYTLAPETDAVEQQTDGLTYHLVDAGTLAQGESRTWTITYENPNSTLTQDVLVETGQAAAPSPAPAPQQEDNSSTIITFALAFVALLAVGAGAFWLGKQTQSAPEPAPSRRRRGSGRGQPPGPRATRTLFCHRCGADLRPDSEFCHKCGAEVRET